MRTSGTPYVRALGAETSVSAKKAGRSVDRPAELPDVPELPTTLAGHHDYDARLAAVRSVGRGLGTPSPNAGEGRRDGPRRTLSLPARALALHGTSNRGDVCAARVRCAALA